MKPHGLLSENKYDQLYLYSSKLMLLKISILHNFTLDCVQGILITDCSMERIYLWGINNIFVYFFKVQAKWGHRMRLLRVKRDHLIQPSQFIDTKIERGRLRDSLQSQTQFQALTGMKKTPCPVLYAPPLSYNQYSCPVLSRPTSVTII